MSKPLTAAERNATSEVKTLNSQDDPKVEVPPSASSTNAITGDTFSLNQNVTAAAASKNLNVERAISDLQSNRSYGTGGEHLPAPYRPPSDGNDDKTPRLCPAEGAADTQNFSRDLATPMHFTPLAEISPHKHALLSHPTILPENRNDVHQLIKPATKNSKWVEPHRGSIHTIRRTASEGHTRHHILQFRVTDRNSRPPEKSMPEENAQTTRLTSNDYVLEPIDRHENGQVTAEGDSAMGEAIRDAKRTERSGSRGRAPIEKRIEATLPDREPAKNVRTRKSSHAMGFFKRPGLPELQGPDGQTGPARFRRDEATVVLHHEESSTSRNRSPSQHRRPAKPLADRSPHDQRNDKDQSSSIFFDDLPIRSEPTESTNASGLPSISPHSSAVHSLVDHDSPQIQRNLPAISSPGKSLLPTRLLEEIRQHHYSTLTEDKRKPTFHQTPSLADVVESEEPLQAKDVTDGIEARDDDEEHISSATYYPHSRPSDDDLDSLSSPDKESSAEIFPSIDAVTPTFAGDGGLRTDNEASPEHIDISVLDINEQPVFHGDYRPIEGIRHDAPELERIGVKGDSISQAGVSSSEPEISSGDDFSDISQAESESTPTFASASRAEKRARKAAAALPVGAVVLEPYSHQVGGHSTIFRFSTKAVCKKLNNRENEFYERIEQRHPDLLRFMPRSVHPSNIAFHIIYMIFT